MDPPDHATKFPVYVQLGSDSTTQLHGWNLSVNQSDVHICGTCKHSFTDINMFVEHKRANCVTSPHKMIPTNPAASLEQASLDYMINNSSHESNEISSLNCPLFQVIIENGSLDTQHNESNCARRLCCTKSSDSQILRSRLLGSQQRYVSDSTNLSSVVMKRDIHIDEEDVATLLANQLANEVVNSAHNTSASSSREDLLDLHSVTNDETSANHVGMRNLTLSKNIPVTGNSPLDNSLSEKQESISNSIDDSMTRTSVVSEDETLRNWLSNKTKSEPDKLVETMPVPDNFNSKQIREKRRLHCDVVGCDFSTIYHKDLIRHMRKHTGEKPFHCNTCQRSFSRADKLQMHLRIHSGEKPHRCQLCQYATVDSGSLRKHMRIHSDERPFKCQVCPYRSRDSSQLTVHLRTHTGDHPFVCTFDSCPAAFKTSSDLKRHTRMHTGEKPFSCEYCDYKCSIKSNLRIHVRLNHTEIKCIQCNSCRHVSTSRREGKNHEKLHAEEHLKCAICSYVCTYPATMRRHMKIHAPEKVYSCKHCSYSSRQLGNLNTHMKYKHPDIKFRNSKAHNKELEKQNQVPPDSSTKPTQFLVKSYSCTLCDASFVREDSWRSHVRQHRNRASNIPTSVVHNSCSTSSNHRPQSDHCEQHFSNSESLSNISNISSENAEEDSESESQECSEMLGVSCNSENISLASETDSKSKRQETTPTSEVLNNNNLQLQPVFLYVQNGVNSECSVETFRNTEIVTSLNQGSSILLAGNCNQYLNCNASDQTNVIEQLMVSLQPGVQYILSTPLENVIDNNNSSYTSGSEGNSLNAGV